MENTCISHSCTFVKQTSNLMTLKRLFKTVWEKNIFSPFPYTNIWLYRDKPPHFKHSIYGLNSFSSSKVTSNLTCSQTSAGIYVSTVQVL